MREIADHARVNKALLHYYFRSKANLARAVWLRVASSFVPGILKMMTSDLSLDDKIDRFVDAYHTTLMGATAEDDLVVETLGVRGFKPIRVGAVLMRDTRDNEDMPTTGWFLNVNNLAYRKRPAGPRRSMRIAWTCARSGSTAAVTFRPYGSTTG